MIRRSCLASIGGVALLGTAAGCGSLSPEATLYGSVQVTVERRNGEPVPETRLILYTGQRHMGYAVTGRDGRYAFTSVPEGIYGVLALPPPGYVFIEQVITTPPTNYRDQLDVRPTRTLVAAFTVLKQGPGTVTARVVEPGGAPVPGVPIAVYSAAGPQASGVTDASGQFTATDLPLGSYGVQAHATAAFRDTGEPEFIAHDSLIVETDFPALTTFTLSPCGGRIAATVLDDTGAAVPNATVTLYTSQGTVASATTGPVGTYVFVNLACDVFGVQVTPPPGWHIAPGPGSDRVDGLAVHRGALLDATLMVQVDPDGLGTGIGDAIARGY